MQKRILVLTLMLTSSILSGCNENSPPIAKIEGGPTSGTASLTVNFSAAGSSDSDGSIVAYDWDLGDGTFDVGVSVSHTYTQPGNYKVTLTVTDDKGKSDDAAVTVVVGPHSDQIVSIEKITKIEPNTTLGIVYVYGEALIYKECALLMLTLRLLGENGSLVGNALDTISPTKPGDRWEFKALGVTDKVVAKAEYGDATCLPRLK